MKNVIVGKGKANSGGIIITEKDKLVLRYLAERVAELAARPVESEKRNLWYLHNALEATRPVIFCDPENGWHEIIPHEELKCEDNLAKKWEFALRREIFWGEAMGDDRVIEPYFDLNYSSTESDWGMHETKIGGNNGGAYTWEAPLKDYSMLDKLKFPEITVDYRSTEQMLAIAEEVFGDLLKVRLKGSWWWTLGMTQTLVNLRGLEQMMLDTYDYPDELHKLMAFLRDGHLAKLDFLEANGLLSLNNDGTYVGSGGFGYTHELPLKDFDGKNVRTCDMWGFSESQETTQISPQMFEEFIFPYQLPIMERFGLNCYGCCEPMNKRWHIVERAPRLRRVSVSPWANLQDMAEKLGGRYIYSMKPSPTDLAVTEIDKQQVRKKLKEAMKITRYCRVEVIMKDNNTIGHNPQNVIDWCRIALEEAESI